jgi:hypothetical protein
VAKDKFHLNISVISDFYTALGQFLSYPLILQEEAERVLYLAIPFDIYNNFFQFLFARKTVENYQIKLIIYNSKKEVIVQWIN